MQGWASTPILDLKTNRGVTAVCLSPTQPNILLTGSQDGTIRVYHLPDTKVKKAVKPIGGEISSIQAYQLHKSPDVKQTAFWVASEKQVLLFNMDDGPQIMSAQEAMKTINVIVKNESDDVLNQIVINQNTLGYSSDSGEVGIVNLNTSEVTKMRTKHGNICNTVSFIPDRPQELVSGGFDFKLFHHDLASGATLSSFELRNQTSAQITSLSPPFILDIAVSPERTIAASTADGRVWLGFGGRKNVLKGRKRRKWEGLSKTEETLSLELKVAEGPVVAIAFFTEWELLTVTLSGTLRMYSLPANIGAPSKNLQRILSTPSVVWEAQTLHIRKVNALAVGMSARAEENTPNTARWLIVGGVDSQGCGHVEVWEMKN